MEEQFTYHGTQPVEWEKAKGANQANWDERAHLHRTSYGLDRFIDDPSYQSDVVAKELPILLPHLPGNTLDGLDLLHLQCHIGTDTLSLARAGANVTGLDFSPESLSVAETLFNTTKTPGNWIESDVLNAAEAVAAAGGGPFDVVYTSIGTITWLNDLSRWAEQIVSVLKPRGVFFIEDAHPMLLGLDETRSELVVTYPYFTGESLVFDDPTTYAGDGTLVNTRTYEWQHPISEILSVLIAAGLRIEHFEEGTTLPWQFSEHMERLADNPERYAYPEGQRSLVPCTFAIVATKPDTV